VEKGRTSLERSTTEISNKSQTKGKVKVIDETTDAPIIVGGLVVAARQGRRNRCEEVRQHCQWHQGEKVEVRVRPESVAVVSAPFSSAKRLYSFRILLALTLYTLCSLSSLSSC
jgi:hypothetical protein